MADKSSIEWTDATWNPIAGCSIVSPGCTNCYAMRQADRVRQMTGPESHYFGTTKIVNGHPVWTGAITTAPDTILLKPLTWRRPRRIFVNSMSDLFHDAVPDAVIDRVFAIMALCPQHDFQLLTKRPKKMRAYLQTLSVAAEIDHENQVVARWQMRLSEANPPATLPITKADVQRHLGLYPKFSFDPPTPIWPLRNVWLGVSVEDQARADERVPILLDTPAAMRWISAEPLLGEIDLRNLPFGLNGHVNALTGETLIPYGSGDGDYDSDGPRLAWVVAGLESGHGARPTHPDCVRSLRDQCVAAGVPFLFKQWGSFSYHEIAEGGAVTPPILATAFRSTVRRWQGDRFVPLPSNASAREAFAPGVLAFPTTKKAAGRMLDGVVWDQYPEVRA